MDFGLATFYIAMVDVIEVERQMKMKDEERRKSNDGEKDSDEMNHPLSREGWIMLLSGEINKEEMKLNSYRNVCIVILIAFLGIEVAFLVVGFQSGVVYDGNVHVNGAIFRAILILIILVLAMFIVLALIMKIYEKRFQKRLKPLIKAREATIFSKSTDFSEIRRIWKDYIKKYYRKLLEKSEMDEIKKELNEGEEKSEEKGSGKSINEQKEVLQAIQRDISNSSQKITRIELGIERTKFVNYLSVVGGFTAAAGVTLLSIWIGMYSSPTLDSSEIEYILFFSGVSLLIIGVLMIRGADHAGTDLKKYPLGLCRQKLFSENKYLYCAVWLYKLFFIVFAVTVLFFFIISLI